MNRRWMPALIVAATMVHAPSSLQAQAKPQQCRIVLEPGARTGYAQGQNTYFAAGDVRLRCEGTSVRIRSDSLASYASQVIEFIGNVRYEDSSMVMTAERGTYRRSGERWEARGNVVTTSSGANLSSSAPPKGSAAPKSVPSVKEKVLVVVGLAIVPGEPIYQAVAHVFVDGIQQADLSVDQVTRQRAFDVRLSPGSHTYVLSVEWVATDGQTYLDEGADSISVAPGCVFRVVVNGEGASWLQGVD